MSSSSAGPACWVVLANVFPHGRQQRVIDLLPGKIAISNWPTLEAGNEEVWRLMQLPADERVFDRHIAAICGMAGNAYWWRTARPIVVVSLPEPAGNSPWFGFKPAVSVVSRELAGKHGIQLEVVELPLELREYGAPIFQWAETITIE